MEFMQNHRMTQVAIIVHDIEQTARHYCQIFGLSMPEIILTDPLDKTLTTFRGQPTAARAKLAFLNMESLTLELIEPDHEPSTWREFLDQKGEGVHHIAFEVDGMQAVTSLLTNQGLPLIQAGEYEGGRYAYVDSAPHLGVMLELLENDN